MAQNDADLPQVRQLVEALHRALGALPFGTIELTFHGGKLVQIEKREKLRLP
jgi:hypothetical protein